MKIRRATEDDRLPLFKLAAAMHAETDFKHYTLDPIKTLNGLGGWIAGQDAALFVADLDGELIGFFAAKLTRPWFSDDLMAVEDCFYVSAAQRGSRAAYLLTREFHRWAASASAAHLRAGVSSGAGRACERLYEHFGMKNMGGNFVLHAGGADPMLLSPDTSGINVAAAANAAISKQALDGYQQTHADQAPARDAAAATAQKVSDAQLKGMDVATQQAQDDQRYTNTTFRPLEKSIVASAQTYDTPERRAQATAAAEGDVDPSFQATRDASERDLARSGVAPGSAKAMSLVQDAAIAQASARAGAGTMASRNVEQQGYARQMDAAELGRNLPSSQATQQQIAASTGNSASANAVAALGAVQSGNGLMGQGFSTAISGNASAGSLFGQSALIEQKAQDSAAQGIGGMAALGSSCTRATRTSRPGPGAWSARPRPWRRLRARPSMTAGDVTRPRAVSTTAAKLTPARWPSACARPWAMPRRPAASRSTR